MPDLPPAARKFVLHWGEMGTKWGVNRTVAQVHALLYLSERPLHAEEITGALSVARSNVSTSLKELQSWGLVKTVHVMGDRRDYFACVGDVWEMLMAVLEERRKREIDPTIAALRECLAEARKDKAAGEHVRRRLQEMLGFFELSCAWYDQVRRLPRGALIRFLKMGGKIRKLVGAA